MREIRLSGLEGGGAVIRSPYPYPLRAKRRSGAVGHGALPCPARFGKRLTQAQEAGGEGLVGLESRRYRAFAEHKEPARASRSTARRTKGEIRRLVVGA